MVKYMQTTLMLTVMNKVLARSDSCAWKILVLRGVFDILGSWRVRISQSSAFKFQQHKYDDLLQYKRMFSEQFNVFLLHWLLLRGSQASTLFFCVPANFYAWLYTLRCKSLTKKLLHLLPPPFPHSHPAFSDFFFCIVQRWTPCY